MNKFSLQNFIRPSVGQSLKTHRLVKGFVPHYVDLVSEADDTSMRSKINPPYPLVLAPLPTTLSTLTGKAVAVIAEDTENVVSGKKIVYATNNWNVYVDDPTQTDLGTAATITDNNGIDIITFVGNIFTSFYSHAKVRWYSGSWADHSGTPTNFGTASLKLFRQFRNTLLVSDNSAGKLYFITSGGVSSLAFTLAVAGRAPVISDYNNYRDNYILIFFEIGGSTIPLYKKTDFVVWNGVDDNYELRSSIQGKFKCSIVKNNTVYVFTQLDSTLVCWEFTGTTFREVSRIQNVIVSTTITNPKMRISSEKDFFVLMATSPGNVTKISPFYWNPFTGDNFFLFEQAQDTLGVLISEQSDSKYQRYLAYFDATDGKLQKITLENSNRFDTANYKSGLISALAPKGEALGRMSISRIVLEYNTPPPAITDAFTLVLKTKDELVSETVRTQTAVIKDTTGNSTSANVGATRAIIDFKANATEFEIDLSLSKTTATYFPVIRRIIVEYAPINLNN